MVEYFNDITGIAEKGFEISDIIERIFEILV